MVSQVAFLAAIAGPEIAEAASKAAIAALDEVNGDGSHFEDVRDSGAIADDADGKGAFRGWILEIYVHIYICQS